MRRKRLLAMLMSFTLIFSGMPAIALAENGSEAAETVDYGTPGENYVEGEVIACVTTNSEKISTKSLGGYSMEPVMDVTAPDEAGISTKSKDTSTEEKTLVLVTGGDTATMIADLEEDPSVEFAEPNYIIKLTDLEPTDPYYEYQWGLKNQFTKEAAAADMNAPEGWSSVGADQTTPVVAVVDSGVDYTHPDLANVMWKDGEKYSALTDLGGGTYGINYSGDPGESVADPMDTAVGHGTHCAGIIAAQWDNEEGVAGVAQNCQIMAVKFADRYGRTDTTNALRGFNYVLEAKKAGVNVVATNNSWGPDTYNQRQNRSISTAVTSLGNYGVMSCFAAGNDNSDLNLNVGGTIVSPYVVMVGAHDSQGYRATFSNYGQSTVDVFSPGTQILSSTSLQDGVTTMPPQYLPQIQDNSTDSYMYENFDGDTSKVSMRLLRMDSDGNEISAGSAEPTTEAAALDGSGESETDASPTETDVPVEMEQTENTVSEEAAASAASDSSSTDLPAETANTEKAVGLAQAEVDESQSCIGFRGNARQLSLGEVQVGELFSVELTVDISDIKDDIKDSDPIYLAAELSMGDVVDNDSFFIVKTCQGGEWQTMLADKEEGILVYASMTDQGWVELSGKSEDTGLGALGDISPDGKVKIRLELYSPLSKADANAAFRMDEFGIGKTASDYFYSDGTSMATPMVTGLAALASSKAVGESDGAKALDVVSRIKGGVNREKAQDELSDESVSGGIVDAGAVLSDEDSARVPVVDAVTQSGNGIAVITGHYFGDSGSITIGGIAPEVKNWTADAITVGLTEGMEGLQEVVVSRSDEAWGHDYLTFSADTDHYNDLNAPQLEITSFEGNALTSVDVMPEGMAAAGTTVMLVGYLDETQQRVIETYDTATGVWELAPLPSENMEITGTFGGITGGKDRIYMLYEDSVEKHSYLGVYDTRTKTWTSNIADEIPSRAGLVVYQGQLLAAGGVDADNKAIADVNIIDPETGEVVDSHSELKLPVALANPMVYASGDLLSVARGMEDEYKICGSVSIYDGKEWVQDKKVFFSSTNSDFDSGQTLYFATGATDSGLIVAGPVAANGDEGMIDTWIFDQTNSWAKDTTRLFSQRKTTQTIGASLGDQFYVLGYNADEQNSLVFRSTTISHTDPAKNPEETTSYPDPVTATVKNGKVDKGTMVELQCATYYGDIYYTMDEGDIVYEKAAKYTEPLQINENTTLRAWAQVDGGEDIRRSQVTTFHWEVKDTEEGDQYEPNESIETATAMSFPSVVKGTLHTARDIDVYQFEVTNKENLSLTLTSPADTMYKITLYDADKKELKTAEYKESSQNIRYPDAASGIYYAEVKSLDESCSEKDTYQLNLTREMNNEEINALDLSEQNMVTALSDMENSIIARDGGANGGGTNVGALSYYSSWAGPVSEDKDPYDGEAYTPDTIDEKYQYKDLSEDALYHLQNALTLPTGSREVYISNMKNAIYNYGAVSGRVEWWDAYATPDLKNLFVSDEEPPLSNGMDGGGHIITVVGWDDQYAKENFTGNPEYVKNELNKDPSELKLPENDGAFICKNSWGTGGQGIEIGENGYFYVSYEDAIMYLVNGYIYMGDELPDNYNHQYYNDTKGMVLHYQNMGSLSTSEVFKNESDQAELLRAVSFQTSVANMRYEIAVRQGDRIKKVAEGKKKYGGFYTERLSQPLLVEAGSEFEVIVLLENEEGGMAMIGITANWAGETSDVEAVAGKAYVYEPDGTNVNRQDIGAQGYYPCIRAYTYDVEDAGYQTTTLAEASRGTEAVSTQAAENVMEDYVSTATASAFTERQEVPAGFDPIVEKMEAANGAEAPEVNLPDKFDLRTTETLTAVRDQKEIGSCWAFAATASLESSIARNGGAAVDYPQSLTLSDSQLSVLLDAENTEAAVNLKATLEGATHASSEKIFWSVTGDTDSVKLNQSASMNGEEVSVLTAVKPGIVTVTAASDADMTLTASCKVTITSQGVESLTLTPSELKLKTGETGQLTAIVEPENAMDKTVLYESDHPEIASVDANGKVTAISGGEAAITAYAGTASATAKVTVTGKEAEKPGNNGTDGTGGGSNNSATSKTSTPLTSAANPVASTVKSVGTGDQTAILIWVLVGVAAVGVAGIFIFLIRRQKKIDMRK